MSGWKEYRVSELCRIFGGGTPKTSVPEYWGGNIPWLSVTDFNSRNKYCYDAEKKITEKGLLESSTKILKKGQIIISARGTVGVVSLLGRDMAFNQSNYGIDAIKELTSNEFLYYLLKDNIPQIISNAYGAVFDTITKETFDQIKVTIPSLSEQSYILSVLSSLDDKIDLLYRQNKTLEQLAETLFRQWFVEEAEESWEDIRICDVADINSKTISKNYSFTEIEYLDTGSITEGVISGFQAYKLADAPSRAQRIVKDNDIVYSLVRPIQRHYGLLNSVVPNAVVSTGFCVISCNNFSPHFLYILLTRSDIVEYFEMVAEGSTSTYPSLKPSDIANFKFKNPPVEKLELFSMFASETWGKIASNSKQIKTLSQLRDNLLPKLMNGEIKLNYTITPKME